MRSNIFKILIIFLVVSIVFVSSPPYCRGQEVQTIKEYLKQALPPQEGRKIVLDEATGLLTITDIPSNHRLIRQLIEAWDVGPQQIRIEARFVEIKEETLREVGVEWLGKIDSSWYIGEGPIGTTGTVSDRPAVYTNIEPDQSSVEEYKYSTRGIPPWTGTEMGAPAEVSGLGLWVGDTTLTGKSLAAYLKALEGKNKANLLSAPTVTTLSGQMAIIELANIIPYASSVELTDTRSVGFGKFETYEIEEKKTGIFLEVTPTVGRGTDIITLELHPEASEVTQQVAITDSEQFPSYLGWPIVDTRSTQTTVTVKSGETIIIGGLIKDDETTTKRKVPLLGDIPLLGNLFRWKNTNRTKTNLVIFLTATLISPEGKEVSY